MAKCPECSVELASMSVRGVDVRRCTECGGLWFDREKLAVLQTQVLSSPVGVQLATPRVPSGACPRCPKATLDSGTLSDRTVAACPDCGGVWVAKSILPPDRSEIGDAVSTIIDVLSFFAPFF